jgi:hypothetical protein
VADEDDIISSYQNHDEVIIGPREGGPPDEERAQSPEGRAVNFPPCV